MADAILAGLSGLGDAFKSAIPTISAVQEMENSRTRLGFEKERMGMEQTRLGMEQEKQSWEKEKFLRDKAIAEAPVNFSQMIGNNEFRDGAIKGMMDYYKTKHPETYKQFHKDEASGDLYGPAYLKNVIRTDASHDADFFKKVYDNIAPRATAKVVEAQQNLDRIKEKLLKVHPNIDSAKETPEYKEAEVLLNSAKQAQSKIAEASIAVEKSKEEMKSAIEKDKMYGAEAQQMQAIKDKAALERTVKGNSISAGATIKAAEIGAGKAKDTAIINLQRTMIQAQAITEAARIKAEAAGGGKYSLQSPSKKTPDKEQTKKQTPAEEQQQKAQSAIYVKEAIDSIKNAPPENKITMAQNVLLATDAKYRADLGYKLVEQGILTLSEVQMMNR